MGSEIEISDTVSAKNVMTGEIDLGFIYMYINANSDRNLFIVLSWYFH